MEPDSRDNPQYILRLPQYSTGNVQDNTTMDGNGSISSQVNVLVEDRVVPNNRAVYPNVYIFGYNHEGKDEVCEYLESVAQDTSSPNFAVNLVQGYMARSAISKEFCTAIKKIRKSMKTEDTSIAFLMVMNPNIHSKSSREKQVVTQLLKEIGSEILKRCVLVLIEGNELIEQTTKLKNHYKEVVDRQLCMCDLYEKIYPRIIAIDISETPPFVEKGQNEQILSLLLAAGARFDMPVENYWKVRVKEAFLFLLGMCAGGIVVRFISYV